MFLVYFYSQFTLNLCECLMCVCVSALHSLIWQDSYHRGTIKGM